MKWFYNLKRVVRVIIAVVSWLPLFIFASVVGGSVGENGENMQTWQALIICALLAVGVVFTVFAIKARAKETKAARDAKQTERAALESRKKITTTENPHIIKMSDAAVTSPATTLSFPIFTKAVGVSFDNCQENIQKSNVGDPLLIKHKPTEEYPESVDVINARTRKRIGRIKSDLAWEFVGEFDERFTLDGEIADITGGSDGQNYGCNIKIVGEHIDD
jgi:type II secretory pathway pseudopilin PulG